MGKTRLPSDDELLRWRIAARAYGLWENEGYVHGRDLDHWLRAEAEIMATGEKRPTAKASRTGRGRTPSK